MSGQVETEIDRSYLDPATKAAAASYLERTGNADLLPILGLAAEPERIGAPGTYVVRGQRVYCSACKLQTRADGICRRSGCGGDAATAARIPDAAVRGVCPLCGNKLPSTRVCRRAMACRKAARERGESA